MATLSPNDLFDVHEPPCVYLVTTNAFVRKDGALVMGAGAAKQMASINPDIPKWAGDEILEKGDEYGVIILRQPTEGKAGIGIFQVKKHWHGSASMELITKSANMLRHIASKNPEVSYHINFPGVGNGKLGDKWAEIRNIMIGLPRNVVVHYIPRMKVLITGSREASKELLDRARDCVRWCQTMGYEVLVGDAEGVDDAVITQCEELGVRVTVHGAYNRIRRTVPSATVIQLPGDYLSRDRYMAERCHMVAAFWNGSSRGTIYTFNAAKNMGKQGWLVRA